VKTAVAPRRARLDRVDAEHIKEMLQTRGWLLFMQRLTGLKESKRSELEQEQSETATAAIRGYLDAIRTVATIPDILMREGSRGKASED
jgi:hypothetical protein